MKFVGYVTRRLGLLSVNVFVRNLRLLQPTSQMFARWDDLLW